MLELLQISRRLVVRGTEPKPVLESIHFSAPSAQVTAIVGAPSSGKTSLLEVLTKTRVQDHGAILLHGRDLAKQPLHPNEFAFVSSSTDTLPDLLTVREILTGTLMLRTSTLAKDAIVNKTAHLIALCGLETVAKERITKLSTVQRRRLQLANALVADPSLVLCQDFTHGLDAKSERELVALLKVIAADSPNRIVINATASLAHLPAFDTVVVLHEGQVCFHGPARAIPHYFTIKSIEDLYPRLAMRPASRWAGSWARHRDSYYKAFKINDNPAALAAASDDDADPAEPDRIRLPKAPPTESLTNTDNASEPATDGAPPSTDAPATAILAKAPLLSQIKLLVRRRWTQLRRSNREWRLQTLAFLGLPVLAVLLIWPNRSLIQAAMTSGAASLPADTLWPAAFTCMMASFIQILMVVFMAVRNGAKEMASERHLYASERLAGVGPFAYLAAKLAFLSPLILWQTLWLGLFVEIAIGGQPGPTWVRLAMLVLTGFAFTSICLAISSRTASKERAQSLCLLLAFAQVLLSGALLGLPRVLGGALQPFVTAYYGWSGIIESLHGHPVSTPIGTMVRTWFAPVSLAIPVLLLHAFVALVIAYLGLRRRRLP